MVQSFLARIPLIISFPTIILSSNLIVPTYQDILEQHISHNINHNSNLHNEQDHFLFSDLIVRLIFLPLFASLSFVSIGCSVNIIKRRWSSVIPISLTFMVVSLLNFILNPIQTTVFTMVTVKKLIHNENNQIYDISMKSHIFNFMKTYLPLIGLCLIINCINEENRALSNFMSTSEPWYYLLLNFVIYLVLIILLRYTYPVLKYKLFDTQDDHNNAQEDNYIENKSTRRKVLISLILGSLASLATMLVLTIFYRASTLQLLMVFVYIGCVTIFFFSLKDSLIEYSQRMSDDGSNDQAQIATLQIPNFMTLIIGFMSISLQYLSFNKVASSFTKDLLTVVFVTLAEYISRVSIRLSYHNKQGYPIKSRVTSTTHNDHHHHNHSSQKQKKSIFKQIVLNKDTRSIFSFLLLNTTFMFVQLLYSFRSKSLGLLSDSLHMALDCTSLFLGLLASVLATQEASDKFPFHLKYLQTLAGFTNGILLLGIVCGIFVEAAGRVFKPTAIEETNELLVVAVLGLLVNLVGLVAFDHTGDGHNHGDNGASSDNMRGIFLHILADTLGSVGVIISTLLIKLTNLHIFDPIASIMIASLILLSSLPLLKSTTLNLLLKLDTKKHNSVKNALNQITTTPGITGYTTPRFWPVQPNASEHAHSHGGSQHSENDHDHEHDHDHGHEHSHNSQNGHNHHHMSKNLDKCTLVGYIHIQYAEGENSTIIKKRVERILENEGIQAWVQVEPQSSSCWCRTTSMSSVINPNISSN
ncbi:similar to Saccharomyces cerevisiae YDR205W MSC2 Member of the cation diffusion facilitator family, localizes to the endoplasmic reticulum and nucleus [Maudiozyma barnettii]|uniref:Zinc transporter n=1 Tax=Maudiozyma barnettii TaxID=61262 RepID=A0A8H2ZKB0_9SACH|nr:metal cation transporter MSC2 [Kazachstania barnettii]CAB4255007.1 similar to Saccharomyces cerevisiae YDR205W MSC2 Member of the cation diffusion facilitator family, localizes to the endoplasmic reticulum and nucleus [Kazachstania barnettii]CAD1783278.1 similar to Saccharomyces cerevisiae YDR205W MSC2 Member of the cation diffusion facilitator family, localizes to the endoplasmic reticulum and nucleus [Kazachstania barnettii]